MGARAGSPARSAWLGARRRGPAGDAPAPGVAAPGDRRAAPGRPRRSKPRRAATAEGIGESRRGRALNPAPGDAAERARSARTGGSASRASPELLRLPGPSRTPSAATVNDVRGAGGRGGRAAHVAACPRGADGGAWSCGRSCRCRCARRERRGAAGEPDRGDARAAAGVGRGPGLARLAGGARLAMDGLKESKQAVGAEVLAGGAVRSRRRPCSRRRRGSTSPRACSTCW